ncbi:hypothetical protein AVEN_85603-1, partial [Araneus ventricosus]
MAYRAENNLEIFQLNFIMAYVSGDLDEEIFMEQADYFIDQKHPDYVYKLQRSLYGLKQAGRQWVSMLGIDGSPLVPCQDYMEGWARHPRQAPTTSARWLKAHGLAIS